MQAAETFTASAILSIPLDEPESLFGPDSTTVPGTFKRLSLRWHPDRNAGDARSAEVFKHVSVLHDEAERRRAANAWRRPGVVRFEAVDGRAYDVSYVRKHAFELGEIYVARTALTYAIRTDAADLAENAERMVASIRLDGADMRKTYEGRMPRLAKSFATRDRRVLVMRKTPDQVLLRDLLAHVGGRLDPRHVAWIVSDLESEAALLGMPGIGLVNPALGPDTLLVSPRYHSVTVAGGWWYAAREGERFPAVPDRTFDNVPPVLLGKGEADPRVMLETVRLTAAECLGARNGVLASRDPSVPAPFGRWLSDTPSSTAVEDYRSWTEAREASFGKRRFVELAVDPDRVYGANQ